MILNNYFLKLTASFSQVAGDAKSLLPAAAAFNFYNRLIFLDERYPEKLRSTHASMQRGAGHHRHAHSRRSRLQQATRAVAQACAGGHGVIQQ